MEIVWACVIAVGMVIEFFSVDFSAICFAAAGIVPLILAACGLGLEWQIPVYVVSALLLILFARPLLKKLMIKKVIPTNVDANFGKKVKLLADVVDGQSQVKLGDVVWTVVCDTELKNGSVVEIVKADGNKLIVKGGK